MVDFVYLITTYDRYDSLINLVNSILSLSQNKKIIIVDDCSNDLRYENLKNYHTDLIYYKTEENNGKKNYWKTVNLLYQKAKEIDFKYGISLPDDVSLIDDFNSIIDKYKGSKIIRLFTQKKVTKTNWGYENWIDCGFIAKNKFFIDLNFEINPIILIENYKVSSGVGKQLTQRLNKLNYEVLNLGSLVKHLGNENSKMHPKLRLEQPLIGEEFKEELIICGMATIYNRKDTLKECIDSILPQVDKLILYQNGYFEVFDFLQNPKIEVISSLITGVDMGDAGKFYKLNDFENSYYFSVDDDLIYPKNYFLDTVRKVNEFDYKKVITYHGRNFNKFPINSYYKSASERYACLHKVNNDVKVQFGGTGVMCFHTSLIKIPFEYFRHPNMADVWIGKYCIENNIEIICLKHNEGYVKYIPQKTTIYDQEHKSDKIQTGLVNGLFVPKIVETKIVETKIEDQNFKKQIELKNSIVLTQKQINYEKINSIFNFNNPNIVSKEKQEKQIINLKLNTSTHSKMFPKKKKR